MKEYMERRIIEAANLYLEQPTNIRKVAKELGTSRSTIHLDLRKRLPKLDILLYLEVDFWLNYNRNAAPRRGGKKRQEKIRESGE